MTEWQPLWKVPAVVGLRVRVEGEEGRIVGFAEHREVVFRDMVVRPMARVDLDRVLLAGRSAGGGVKRSRAFPRPSWWWCGL